MKSCWIISWIYFKIFNIFFLSLDLLRSLLSNSNAPWHSEFFEIAVLSLLKRFLLNSVEFTKCKFSIYTEWNHHFKIFYTHTHSNNSKKLEKVGGGPTDVHAGGNRLSIVNCESSFPPRIDNCESWVWCERTVKCELSISPLPQNWQLWKLVRVSSI